MYNAKLLLAFFSFETVFLFALMAGIQSLITPVFHLLKLFKTKTIISVVATVPPTQPVHVTQQPFITDHIAVCFEGMDISACPKEGCPDGLYCDGLQCVRKNECPCMVDGKIVRVRHHSCIFVGTSGCALACHQVWSLVSGHYMVHWWVINFYKLYLSSRLLECISICQREMSLIW